MITITGICLGTKKVQKDPAKDPIYSVGVAYEPEGGFAGQTETMTVRLSQEQVMSGFLKVFQDAQGKAICLPFRFQANLWNGSVYENYYCTGEPVQNHNTMKKVA